MFGNEIMGEAWPGGEVTLFDGLEKSGLGGTSTACMEIFGKFRFRFVIAEECVGSWYVVRL